MNKRVVSPVQGWASIQTDRISRALPGAGVSVPLRGVIQGALRQDLRFRFVVGQCGPIPKRASVRVSLSVVRGTLGPAICFGMPGIAFSERLHLQAPCWCGRDRTISLDRERWHDRTTDGAAIGPGLSGAGNTSRRSTRAATGPASGRSRRTSPPSASGAPRQAADHRRASAARIASERSSGAISGSRPGSAARSRISWGSSRRSNNWRWLIGG